MDIITGAIMNTETLITRFDHSPSQDVLDAITLDAPKYVDADARHVSRILKAAGLPRAERIRGTSGSYSHGYNVSEGSLSIYGRISYPTPPEDVALMEDAVSVLRQHGFVVTGGGTTGRHVFKRDEEVGMANLHLVYVAVGDTLVGGYSVPAFMAEQERRRQAFAAAKAQERKDAEERQDRRDALLKALSDAGVNCHSTASFQITVDADSLQAYLSGKEVSA